MTAKVTRFPVHFQATLMVRTMKPTTHAESLATWHLHGPNGGHRLQLRQGVAQVLISHSLASSLKSPRAGLNIRPTFRSASP